MKRLTVLLLFASVVAGCAAPQQKAEKLAKKIDKESLETPSVSSPQEPQPQQLFKDAGGAVAVVASGAGKVLETSAGWVWEAFVMTPVAIVSCPLQALGDCFNILGEFGKAVFPPPPPKVV